MKIKYLCKYNEKKTLEFNTLARINCKYIQIGPNTQIITWADRKKTDLYFSMLFCGA